MLKYKMSVLMISALLLVLPGDGKAFAVDRPFRGGVFIIKEEGRTLLKVTGKGSSPYRARRRVQARLLARRAATVEAYKRLTEILGTFSSYLVEGSGYIQADGFIKGAEVSGVRYLSCRRCEVDLMLPVCLKRGAERRIQGAGYTVLRDGIPLEYHPREITEEEWMRLIEERASTRTDKTLPFRGIGMPLRPVDKCEQGYERRRESEAAGRLKRSERRKQDEE